MKYKDLKAEKLNLLAEIENCENVIMDVMRSKTINANLGICIVESNLQRISLCVIKINHIDGKLKAIKYKYLFSAAALISLVGGVFSGVLSK